MRVTVNITLWLLTSLFLYAVLPTPLYAATTTQDQASDLFSSDHDRLHADFLLHDGDRPPVNGDWQPVRLPHLWAREGLPGQQGWYRFRLSDQPWPDSWALYLWRFSMNQAVWLNQQFLGDGGSFTEPMARNWNRPFLYRLPESAWQATDNYVYVRLATYPGFGHLPPVVIGPWKELSPQYERRFTWQITFSQATFDISLITALLALTLWISERHSTQYLFFGLSCLAWCFYSLNLYIQNIPVSARVWWWLVHSAVDWYGICLALFAHRLMALHYPLRERLMLGFGLAATLYYAVVSLDVLSATNSYFHSVTLVIALYLVGLSAWQTWRQREPRILAFACCMLIVAAFGLHDLSMNAMVAVTLWKEQFFWLQFSAPFLMITMLVILAYRFVQDYQARLDTEQRIRLERERIFSDIHDDVGSKVLSLVYSAESEEQAALAREALQEIRAIVAGGRSQGGQFSVVLAASEAEARERCEKTGIELNWVKDMTSDPWVTDRFHYHLQRILRELISNVIKHAGTTRLDIYLSQRPGELELVARDFGCGWDGLQPGNGVAGMNRRTGELGGSIVFEQAEPGCRVRLILPLR
ncbi:MAG: hypothetical protein KDI36_07940 [Pseudomonadales bacterium]|nr:hypothetical protein [Pseudomonadales bacterium]